MHNSIWVKVNSDNQRPLDYSDCVEIIVEIAKVLPITIVLDAFDECDQDKSPTLIENLKEVIRRYPDGVKVFISTRPFPAIENDTTFALRNIDLVHQHHLRLSTLAASKKSAVREGA